MSTNARQHDPGSAARTALEHDFPVVELSELAQHESWRKEVNRPLYHIHKWWATRLGSVFRAITLAALTPPETSTWSAFYNRHNLLGKVVLDPFMGSGTSLGEALKLGARAIGCDINPVSTFLVRQALTRVTEAELRPALEQLEREAGSEIRRYYQTRDPQTGQLIPVLYFFWVKTLVAPNGETIPLFDRYVFAQDAYPKKKPRAQIVCPRCWAVIEDRYDATDLTCSACANRFNPQIGPASGQYVTTSDGARHKVKDLLPKSSAPSHRLYALLAQRPNGEKVYLAPGPEDIGLYDEAKARLAVEDLPLPTLAVRSGHNTDQARGYNYLYWRDFFNDRQLLCLGLLLRAICNIQNEAIQEQLLCLFSSSLEFNNLFCSYKGEGTGAVRHMFSNHILKPERMPLENCIWGTEKGSGTFRSLFASRLLRAKRYLDEPFEVCFGSDLFGDRTGAHKIVASDPIQVDCVQSWDGFVANDRAAMVLNGDSSHIPIPDASVDAVITDPPYFDFVHYSELSDFFFAWLAPVLKSRYSWFNRADSSAAGEVQHKDPRVFAKQLGKVFAECRRVLKNDGILAFSFHHSRADGWAAILDAIASAGLYVVSAYPVHAELRAASPKSAAKDPISLDAILVCKKQPQNRQPYDVQTVLERTRAEVLRLSQGGMKLSVADQFVIAASQVLALSSGEELSYEASVRRLETVQGLVAKLEPALTSPIVAAREDCPTSSE